MSIPDISMTVTFTASEVGAVLACIGAAVCWAVWWAVSKFLTWKDGVERRFTKLETVSDSQEKSKRIKELVAEIKEQIKS